MSLSTNGSEMVTRHEALRALSSVVQNKYDEGGGSTEAMKAIASQVYGFIEADVKAASIAEFMLQQEQPKTGAVKLGKEPEHEAWWINKDGTIKSTKDIPDLETLPTWLLQSMPRVNILDLKRGDVESMDEQTDIAKGEMARKMNLRVYQLMEAAATNIVEVSGSLDAAAMNQALKKVEDYGNPSLWLGRGSTFADVRGDTTLGNGIKDELQIRGFKNLEYGGAGFLFNIDIPTNRVLLRLDEPAGKIVPEFPMEPKEVELVQSLEIAIQIWFTTRAKVTHPSRYAIIKIT